MKGFVPDAHLTGELKGHRGPLKCAGDSPGHVRMRARLCSAAGQARYLDNADAIIDALQNGPKD